MTNETALDGHLEKFYFGFFVLPLTQNWFAYQSLKKRQKSGAAILAVFEGVQNIPMLRASNGKNRDAALAMSVANLRYRIGAF